MGLNISPRSYKLCSFNCVYCQYGRTTLCTVDASDSLSDFPTPDDFRKALESALYEHKGMDYITFSGNGEPTIHPQFDELVDIAKELKEKYSPEAKLAVLSNSSTVNLEKARRALAKLDVRIMKLDAGDLETFVRVNRPCEGVDYWSILNGLKSLGEVTLQTMFVDGIIRNIGDQEVRQWIERVGEIQPLKVQIYSLHRLPAEPFLRQVPVEKLSKIAVQTEKATGVLVEVISGHPPYRKKTSRRI